MQCRAQLSEFAFVLEPVCSTPCEGVIPNSKLAGYFLLPKLATLLGHSTVFCLYRYTTAPFAVEVKLLFFWGP